jgi:hypothetical protein
MRPFLLVTHQPRAIRSWSSTSMAPREAAAHTSTKSGDTRGQRTSTTMRGARRARARLRVSVLWMWGASGRQGWVRDVSNQGACNRLFVSSERAAKARGNGAEVRGCEPCGLVGLMLGDSCQSELQGRRLAWVHFIPGCAGRAKGQTAAMAGRRDEEKKEPSSLASTKPTVGYERSRRRATARPTACLLR